MFKTELYYTILRISRRWLFGSSAKMQNDLLKAQSHML